MVKNNTNKFSALGADSDDSDSGDEDHSRSFNESSAVSVMASVSQSQAVADSLQANRQEGGAYVYRLVALTVG